jgi:cytochrome c oxidase subunit 2
MLASVRILEPKEYREFEERTDPPGPITSVNWGERLFTRNACPVCHGIDGSGLVAGSKSPGPKLADIYNTMQPMSTGASVVADENYVRESILRPNAQVVAGYTTVQMPALVMKDAQLDSIIAYIKSLK